MVSMSLDGSFDVLGSLSKSIDRARKFIFGNLGLDGFWSDFLTLAGESVFWVSGYVGSSLISGGSSSGERELLEKTCASMLRCQNLDGGWGYGYGVPSDGDSTSWCLLFLSKLIDRNREELRRALAFLLKHQSPFDGGFRTYAEPRAVGRFMRVDESVSFEGWGSSQMCVSAVAAQALMENRSPKFVEEVLSYIRDGQSIQGYWNSYWWTGKLYATSHSLRALNLRGERADVNRIMSGQRWIAQTQLPDGSWTDSTIQESGWAFSTALAVSGLIAGPKVDFEPQVKNGVRWLLEHQLLDGSWVSNHILRIPFPWSKDPWNQQSWKVDGKAVSAVIRDHRRLFTAATVFTALSQYKKRMLEGDA
jgi:squalene-hopene/tetraprenyl-beta-curcumene cyclase